MSTTPLTSDRWPANDRNVPALVKLVRGVIAQPEGRIALVGAFGCLGLLGLIFWPNLRHFVYVWSTDENYSHGFLVPLISLYFANQAARAGPGRGPVGDVARAGPAGGRDPRAGWPRSSSPSGSSATSRSCSGLAGVICALIGGRDVLRRYGFAHLLPGLHGPAAGATCTPGSPRRCSCWSARSPRRAQRDGGPGALRGEHDDAARRRPDVRGRGVQRDAAADRLPRPDHGRGLSHRPAGLVSGRRSSPRRSRSR